MSSTVTFLSSMEVLELFLHELADVVDAIAEVVVLVVVAFATLM